MPKQTAGPPTDRIDPFADPIRRMLSVAETAAVLGLPEITVRRLAYRGELPSAKAGTRLLILRSGVERLLNEGHRHADG